MKSRLPTHGLVLASLVGLVVSCTFLRPLDEYEEGPTSVDAGMDVLQPSDARDVTPSDTQESGGEAEPEAQAGCPDGFEDCDGDETNGCEANLSTSADHCGGCDRPCSSSAWDVACVGGECQLTSCPDGLDDCNGLVDDGCETSTAKSAEHCGQCNAACPAGFECLSGVCSCVKNADCNYGDGGICMPDGERRVCRCAAGNCQPGEVCLAGNVCGSP